MSNKYGKPKFSKRMIKQLRTKLKSAIESIDCYKEEDIGLVYSKSQASKIRKRLYPLLEDSDGKVDKYKLPQAISLEEFVTSFVNCTNTTLQLAEESYAMIESEEVDDKDYISKWKIFSNAILDPNKDLIDL